MSLKARFVLFSVLFLGILTLLMISIWIRGEEHARAQRQIESDIEETGVLLLLEDNYAAVRIALGVNEHGQRDVAQARRGLADVWGHLAELQNYVQTDEVEDDDEQAEMTAVTQLVAQTKALEALLDGEITAGQSAEVDGAIDSTIRDIHSSIELFRRGAFGEIREAVSRLNSQQHALQTLTMNGAIVLVIILGLASVGFSYGLLRPVRSLTRMTRRLSKIDFNVEERNIPKGEMGELTRAFISMAKTLGSFTREIEARVEERTRELEASRSLMKLMLDSLPDAVALRCSDNELLACNGMYSELFAKGEESLEALCEKERSPQGYYVWKQGDGTAKLLDLQVSSAHVTYEGEKQAHLEYVRDVTRLTEVEAALAQSQRLISLGRLSAGIAHEVNSPLTAIGACAEGLLDRSQRGTLDPDEVREYLQVIHQEVYRCKSLTEKLLDLSRQRQESVEPTAVCSVVEECAKLLAYLNKSRNIQLSVHKDAEAGEAMALARPAALRQICINLLMNANHASEPGSNIEVTVKASQNHVAVEVRDYGIGVAPGDMGRLFEPFFTKRPTKDGTGLGLFLCREMTSAMGGSLGVKSDGPGHGACFELILPRYTAAQKPGETI